MQKTACFSVKRRRPPKLESFKACHTWFLEIRKQRGGPNMAKKAATAATITLKHLAAGHPDRSGGPDRQASQEGRAHPHRRPWHSPGPQARCPHGP